MNLSKIVFPSRYASNTVQACGESDFYDVSNHEKFEAKLPFDKTEGRLICNKNSALDKWLEFMMNEESEFGDKIIVNRGKYKIENLQLYKTLEKRLNTVKEDENAVILFPCPITLDYEPVEGTLHMVGFTSDILSALFDKLEQNKIIGERKVYVIYPSMDKKIVLRYLNKNIREYLVFDKLNDIFEYSFALLENEE